MHAKIFIHQVEYSAEVRLCGVFVQVNNTHNIYNAVNTRSPVVGSNQSTARRNGRTRVAKLSQNIITAWDFEFDFYYIIIHIYIYILCVCVCCITIFTDYIIL